MKTEMQFAGASLERSEPVIQHAFIVRIWDEQVNEEGQIMVWRGSIEHVGRDRRFYFNDLGQMAGFIQDTARIGPQPAAPRRHAMPAGSQKDNLRDDDDRHRP